MAGTATEVAVAFNVGPIETANMEHGTPRSLRRGAAILKIPSHSAPWSTWSALVLWAPRVPMLSGLPGAG